MSWKTAFAEITQKKTHSEQGIYWLNGFWSTGAEDYKEEIWSYVHSFIECQIDGPVLYGRKKQDFTEQYDLDEFKSHRILEQMGETLTVVELRRRLKDLDIDNNNRMAISEYLLDKYKKTPQQLVDAPQGDVDPVALAAAQEACDRAGEALADADDAKKKADKALAAVRKAEAELQAIVDEISRQQQAKLDKIADLQRIVDSPGGAVKKGKAANEIQQLMGEDPLPLRKAKLTQQAAVRVVEKLRKVAEVEAEKAHQAKVDAEAALEEAHNQLDELKKKGGVPNGKIWWMERTLEERKKFMK